MKKTLLLQTALVAAAGLFVADIANAQETPIGVTVGGYMVRGFTVQDRGTGASQVDEPAVTNAKSDSEIYFNIRAVLNDGTVVGGQVQLEGHTDTDQIDESYIFVENHGIGRLELGSTDRVANKMIYGAPNAIPGHSTTQVSDNAATANTYSLWFQNAGNDAEGVNLFSASNRYFGSKTGKGLQVGVSYLASDCEDANCALTTGNNDTAVRRTNSYEAAANYLESFGSVDVALYAGYINVQTSSTNSDRVDGWQAGTTLTYNVGDGSTVQFGGLYTGQEITATQDRKGWALGLRYLTNGANAGSIGVGIEGGRGKVDDAGVANDTTTDVVMLGVTYQVAKGILAFGGLGYNELDDKDTASADNKQTFGTVGLRLDF